MKWWSAGLAVGSSAGVKCSSVSHGLQLLTCKWTKVYNLLVAREYSVRPISCVKLRSGGAGVTRARGRLGGERIGPQGGAFDGQRR